MPTPYIPEQGHILPAAQKSDNKKTARFISPNRLTPSAGTLPPPSILPNLPVGYG